MNDSRVLILHGIGHHRPRAHWLWWLAEELRARRVPVQYPQFPTPDDPRPDAWLTLVRAELEMLGGGQTVIAHSLGTIVWSHIAPSIPEDLRPARVALVAPPSRHIVSQDAGDFASLSIGPLDTERTVIVGRETDPVREEPLDQLAERWGAPYVVVPGEGHLTPADGFGPYPGALEWALGGGDASWVHVAASASAG